jgi:outer membrane cobalamin receptor
VICYRSARLHPLLLALTTFFLALVLAASASAQTLRGRVLDPESRPVSGATVIVSHGAAVIATLAADRDGRFGPLTLGPGEYELSASAPGLGAPPKHFTVTQTAPADLDVPLGIRAVQESVVVSAAQIETPLSRTTDSVTVLDASELRTTQTHSVADALRRVPGFSIVANGGLGALTSIFPRGGESDYTLVLVDGVPQNAFGGGFDAAHLDTAGLERIEVVRGPESALYGNGAIGGVVQLVTRQGGPPRANAAFEAGGYGFTRSTASASGSSGAWRWGGSFDRMLSDGDTRFRPNLGRRVENDDYDRLVGSGSFGWSDRPSRSVRVDVRGARDDRGNPGAFGSDPEHLYGGLDLISRGHNDSRDVAASASFGDTRPGRHQLQFTWGDAKSRFTSPPDFCFPAQDPCVANDRTRRVTGRYQFDLEQAWGGMSAGGEILHEQVDNTYITGETFQPVPVARLVSGLFAEARPALGNRLFLTAGARLERIERTALEESPGSRPAFPDDVVWSLNPKLAIAWLLRDAGAKNGTKLRASAGTGIKPPTGLELAYTDNPSLKPERNRSVDAGIEQAIGGPGLVADATWFFNRYDDLIVAVAHDLSGISRYQTDNIANARATGVETGVRWQSTSGLSARAAWTWLDTEVLGLDQEPSIGFGPYAVGQSLVRRPRHQAFGEIAWTRSRSTAFLTIGGRGRMLDLEPNFGSTLVNNPGYAEVSFGGSFTLMHNVEVFGRVLNVANRDYEDAFGFPALGRRASVGVRVATGR